MKLHNEDFFEKFNRILWVSQFEPLNIYIAREMFSGLYSIGNCCDIAFFHFR